MQFVTGDMEAGEARAAMAAIGGRQRGSNSFYYLLQGALIVAGVATAFALRFSVNLLAKHEVVDLTAASGLGAAAGAIAYIAFCRPYVIKRFRRSMTDRGLAVRFPQTLTISEDAITLVTGAITRTAEWTAVTEIFKTKNYWIFLVQMEPWFAPARFFSDEEAEKAFIRTAISRLSNEARDRSKAAARYAGT